jgi:hypothetical protein
MNAAVKSRRASELLLAHCFGVLWEPPRPTAKDRLDAVLGPELALRLVASLSPVR